MANTNENTYFDLGNEWSVTNVRKLEFGTFFTLQVPGLSLYDLRAVPAGKNSDGKSYPAFIAAPETKGKDGNFYKRYGLYLDKEDTLNILAEVDNALKEVEKPNKRGRR